MDIELLRKIYLKLEDDVSKNIFVNRIMFNITEDIDYISKCIKLSDWGGMWKKLDFFLHEGENVIFGAGSFCGSLLDITSDYSWKCIIDNNSKTNMIQGIPIVDAREFLKNYSGQSIVIASTDYYGEMNEQLVSAGVPNDKIFNLGHFCKRVYTERQYFDLEYLYQAENREVFVDAGCYDGGSSIQLKKWSKHDVKVYAVEPDVKNAKVCQEVLSKEKIDYELYPFGLWSEKCTLNFKGDGNSVSQISQEGNDLIECITIDEMVGNEKITYIKMDIEGAELQALYGAEKTIKRDKPKMAICVYHKLEDLWQIPEVILSFNPEYKLYMRHYSLCDSETVLYAI